ncbi:MAG TPA: hypothetical protein VGO16_05710 [Pseudonocardiaceae bacterium]|nr:hypothetical protein [Pseudonocardiaceae bacterium]
MAISSANKSNASSIAAASNPRTTAATSAVRFGSGARSIVCALEISP